MHPYLLQEIARQRMEDLRRRHGNTAWPGPAVTAR
jgi:hypothetical protein